MSTQQEVKMLLKDKRMSGELHHVILEKAYVHGDGLPQDISACVKSETLERLKTYTPKKEIKYESLEEKLDSADKRREAKQLAKKARAAAEEEKLQKVFLKREKVHKEFIDSAQEALKKQAIAKKAKEAQLLLLKEKMVQKEMHAKQVRMKKTEENVSHEDMDVE